MLRSAEQRSAAYRKAMRGDDPIISCSNKRNSFLPHLSAALTSSPPLGEEQNRAANSWHCTNSPHGFRFQTVCRRAGTSRRPYADTSDPFVGAGVLDGPHSAKRCHGFAQRRDSPRLSCLPLRGRWIRAFHSPDPEGEAFERVSDPSKTPRGRKSSGRCIISLYQPREVNCLLPYQKDHTLAIKLLLFISLHGIINLRRNSIISKQGMVFTIGKNAFSIFAFPVWIYKNCVPAKELCVFRA